ncbi:MAG: hypothetical protein PCALPYG88_0710 [uncultured Paraburkholderia sp.]|uniref:DUF485 domain-containing protein n=1 Tax=uncultured Paraburkholderia sp. TaxID=1822466 RepID=UPI00259787AD|nr:DUF485 domain-containing protein [uncultured Paraburkholderia sp.]CAH2894407.1 MAG: hypothetical protein PCALPYG08_0943 [uncultured Paraburkholderia sp.]CAH2910990.1 MAG: hypothetical protein PCALPYG88_0710 [uncultured Paraburkholderia sp.]
MQITTSPAAGLPTPETLRSVGRRHQHVALALTVLMLAAFFLFILSIAYFKEALSVQIMPGLSLAILVGVASVAFALVLTFAYVAWVNRVHDVAVHRLAKGGR